MFSFVKNGTTPFDRKSVCDENSENQGRSLNLILINKYKCIYSYKYIFIIVNIHRKKSFQYFPQKSNFV